MRAVLQLEKPSIFNKACVTQGTFHTLNRECSGIGGQGEGLGRRRLQRGSLTFNQKENRWEGRWYEDVLESDGTVSRPRKRAALGTLVELPTKKLAQRRLDQLMERVNATSYRPGRVATIAEFTVQWCDGVLKLQAPSSVRAARSHVRCWIKPRLGRFRLDSFTQNLAQDFVNELAGRKLSRKTIVNVVSTLAAMLRDARSWEYAVADIRFAELRFPTLSERRPRPIYTPGQVREVLARAVEPWRTLFMVAAMTALRPGEILGLKWVDLDFERRVIHVRRSAWYGQVKAPKTAAGTRSIPIPTPLATALKAHRDQWKPNREGFLFATRNGRPPSSNKVQNDRLRPILEKMGIWTPGCGLYSFRHTLATELLEAGASPKTVQQQLGHSDPRVTLNIYAHIVPEHHADVVGRVAQQLDPAQDLITLASERIQ